MRYLNPSLIIFNKVLTYVTKIEKLILFIKDLISVCRKHECN